MGNDNRDQGKPGQQNVNAPASGKDNLANKNLPGQTKYDPQSKSQSIPGKDTYSDTKGKFPDAAAKKTPNPMAK